MSVDADHDTSADADQEWELQEQLVNEAVRLGLETSFREPILEAVRESGAVETREETASDTQETAGDVEESDSGRATTVVQGLLVFAVMFVALYVVLRKLTGEDAE